MYESHTSGSLAVHPRLRGELTVPRDTKRFSDGSSPLTRGTRGLLNPESVMTTVHPRLRGELAIHGQCIYGYVGSSPLTRGTRCVYSQGEPEIRFIPAYAGNSLKDGINPSIHTLGI